MKACYTCFAMRVKRLFMNIIFYYLNTNLKKMSKINKFVINLPKIMEKAKMILIITEMGLKTSNLEVWGKK